MKAIDPAGATGPHKPVASHDGNTQVPKPSGVKVDLEEGKTTKRMASVHDLPLTEDEKTKSRKSYAYAFDQLVAANLKLVGAVDRLVKVSYVVQATQLILVLVMLCVALSRR